MAQAIVQSTEIVTLIGAGAVAEAVLTESLRFAPRILAADGGAVWAVKRGKIPDAVFGDLDSLDATTRRAIPEHRLHASQDQQTTDFEKALSAIIAPLILAVGFTGGRIDHELAAYNALVRITQSPTIILGEDDICLALSNALTLELPVGTRVSLFPMAEVRCRSTGLRWPTDHLTFQPWGRVGTSNETSSHRITLTSSGPGMLVILPRSTLAAVISALSAPRPFRVR